MSRKTWMRAAVCLAGWCLFLLGCAAAPTSPDKEILAYVSVDENSDVVKAIDDLPLGILFNFHLKRLKADETWVRIWVEGYRNGKPTDPFRFSELSYGLHPNDKVEEGPMGFGIINPDRGQPLFYMYSAGVAVPPHPVAIPIDSLQGRAWGYAIGDETVKLADGETKLLGVYRLTGPAISTYDYSDPEHVKRLIETDETVLLLKIQSSTSSPTE